MNTILQLAETLCVSTVTLRKILDALGIKKRKFCPFTEEEIQAIKAYGTENGIFAQFRNVTPFQAKEEGRKAFKNGIGFYDNPYAPNENRHPSPVFDAWNMGWLEQTQNDYDSVPRRGEIQNTPRRMWSPQMRYLHP